jgi:putative lipase involved disintegration of autophagic bodies
MTEQIAGQNVLLLAEIANFSYNDSLTDRQIDMLASSGFNYVTASTPNYIEIVDYQTGSVLYHHDGFNGQAFYFGGSNTLIIGLRGTDSLDDWFQNLSGNSVPSGITHPQVTSAREFAARMISQYPNASIVFTGHSLGAYLGTVVGYEYRNATVVVLIFTQN